MAATPTTMQAWSYTTAGDISVLSLGEQPVPRPGAKDLLIKVHAMAMNPVDTKVRKGGKGKFEGARILGWDGAGVVVEAGAEVKGFAVGAEVYFAGVINRHGCNAQYVAVDYRIVAHKPRTLNWEQAASVPLCAITAWEGMFEGFNLTRAENANINKTMLIIAGAGGVGSIGIQIAKKVLGFGKVVATASRDESRDYCLRMGADHVIDHRQSLVDQLKALGIDGAHFTYVNSDLAGCFEAVLAATRPCGAICQITTNQPLDIEKAKGRRITIVNEFMFARAMYEIEPEKQGELLREVAHLIDTGVLQHTLTTTMEWSELREAHTKQESGTTIGKTSLRVPQ